VARRREHRDVILGGQVSPEERDRRQRDRALDEQVDNCWILIGRPRSGDES
jgi:hypothetical protein